MIPSPSYPPPPPSDDTGEALPGDAEALILAALKATRPWVTFLAMLGFLMAFAMIAGGVWWMLAGHQALPAGAPWFGRVAGVMYIGCGAFYLVPSLLLWRYASGIGAFAISDGSADALAFALQKQASFWRFIGITVAVMVALYALAFVGIVGFGQFFSPRF